MKSINLSHKNPVLFAKNSPSILQNSNVGNKSFLKHPFSYPVLGLGLTAYQELYL
jgi:hypothetical protein